MEFQLLGSVCLRKDGQTVWPQSGRARVLLASLAWQPNEFVSDKVLIDRVWGEELPKNPTDALYTSAKRLRSEIREVSPAEWVVRRRGGYLLAAAPENVDLHRFRSLISAARDADNDESAVQLYEAAMRIWSGPPLADVDTVWTDRTRDALNEEWLSARLDAIESGLRIGNHARSVPVLTELAARNPLDERIAALLMLTLYRDGRRHEAARSYFRIRKTLIRELGDGPGASLQQLHERLVRGDPPDAAYTFA